MYKASFMAYMMAIVWPFTLYFLAFQMPKFFVRNVKNLTFEMANANLSILGGKIDPWLHQFDVSTLTSPTS